MYGKEYLEKQEIESVVGDIEAIFNSLTADKGHQVRERLEERAVKRARDAANMEKFRKSLNGMNCGLF